MIKKKLELLISNEEYHISNMKLLLKDFPKGKLYTRKRGNHLNYSVYRNGKEKWITRDNELVRKYQKKELLESRLVDFQNSNILLKELIEILPDSIYDDPFLMQWACEEFEYNTYKEEQLTYITLKGHKVRSKSERFIANALFELKIPYRYECVMYLSGYKMYPDFLILKPNGELLIWEHFGLLDDQNYQNNANKKIKIYNNSGYTQFRNLICTTEDDLKDISVISDIIQRFYFS